MPLLLPPSTTHVRHQLALLTHTAPSPCQPLNHMLTEPPCASALPSRASAACFVPNAHLTLLLLCTVLPLCLFPLSALSATAPVFNRNFCNLTWLHIPARAPWPSTPRRNRAAALAAATARSSACPKWASASRNEGATSDPNQCSGRPGAATSAYSPSSSPGSTAAELWAGHDRQVCVCDGSGGSAAAAAACWPPSLRLVLPPRSSAPTYPRCRRRHCRPRRCSTWPQAAPQNCRSAVPPGAAAAAHPRRPAPGWPWPARRRHSQARRPSLLLCPHPALQLLARLPVRRAGAPLLRRCCCHGRTALAPAWPASGPAPAGRRLPRVRWDGAWG